MSRVATWRRGPSDPDTARRWLFQSGLEERTDRLRMVRALSAYSAFFAVFGALFVLLPKALHVIGPFGSLFAFGVGTVLSRLDKKTLPPREKPPEVGEAFEVRIAIRDARGLRTGSDRGWLIFSEGWILFEGARADFAVTRGESYRRSHEPSLGLKLEDGRTVEIGPLGEPPIPKQLNRAFNAWEIAPIPEGKAVLPPREIHPEIWVHRHAWGVFGALAAAAVVGFGVAFGSWFAVAVGAFTLLGCLLHSAGCARRLRAALRHSLPVPEPPLSTIKGKGREECVVTVKR